MYVFVSECKLIIYKGNDNHNNIRKCTKHYLKRMFQLNYFYLKIYLTNSSPGLFFKVAKSKVTGCKIIGSATSCII